MEEQKYTITEETELPSKGAIYGKPVNTHIKLRAMTMKDEMRRTAKTDKPNTLLADIIEDCMIEKPTIHVADMCMGDFEYLLHQLRIVTYGETYEMTAMCPFCGEINDIKLNLDEEKVLEFDEEEFNSLLTLTLPSSKKEVLLNFHTPRIVDSIKNKAEEERRKAKEPLDFEKYFKVLESINTVEGVKLNYVQKENFVKNLAAKDMGAILRRLEKINNMVGTDQEIRFKCSKCGEEVLTFFRYTSEFFEPTDYE